MTVLVKLLIAAPMLQDLLVDVTGEPMSNGTITMYQDANRTILKNWYYQTGSFNSYSYIALPNPLTLSAAGTIQDVNGNDVIPFYYPYNELDSSPNPQQQPYFVVIQNQAQTNIITRANFPFLAPQSSSPTTTNPTNENYIINNRFWRNVGTAANVYSSVYINSGATYYYQTLAPSQHDSFSMPDFIYMRNINSSTATETITFTEFPEATVLTNDITPEFYISHVCTGAGAEEFKVYQFPVSLHLATLGSGAVNYTVTIQVQQGSVSTNNQINLYMWQFAGTGAAQPAPLLLTTNPIIATSSWTQYTVTGTFAADTISVGAGGDDAFYLQIAMPIGSSSVCSINFTLPSLYLSDEASVPTNSFATYDQIDAVINSPRTGDVRMSFNQFYYYGWIPMNGGLIALTNPGSLNFYTRANEDTWPLFNLLWNFAKTYDSGSNSNPICQMFSNNGSTLSATNYGSSAYADFTATGPTKGLQISSALSRVLLGTVPLSAMFAGTSSTSGGYVQVTDSSGTAGALLLTSVSSTLLQMYQGCPVVFTNTGGALNGHLAPYAVYYISPQSATTFFVSTSFANALAGTYVSYGTAGSGATIAHTQLTGSSEGEYSHTQLTAEVGVHTHPNVLYNDGEPVVAAASGGSIVGHTVTGGATSIGSGPWTVAASASNVPFNVTQPGVYFNFYMKL